MENKKELRIFSKRFFNTGINQFWRIGYSLDNEKLLFEDILGKEQHEPSDDEVLEALSGRTGFELELVSPDDIKDSPAEVGKPVSGKPVPTQTTGSK